MDTLRAKIRSFFSGKIIPYLLALVIVVLVNIIGSFLFVRLDLTTEKRFTLSEATKDMLDGIEDIVFVRVYLEGDFPAGFKRLARSTKEMLDEFRAHNQNIEYEFVNPSASTDANERNKIYQQLAEKGLSPTDLKVKTKEGTSTQLIFPGAIVTYSGREMPLQLLSSQRTAAPEEILNNSIQNLEFSIADAIRKLVINVKPKIAFIEGHGELDARQTADAAEALSAYYSVERIRLDERLNSLADRMQLDSNNTRLRNKYAAIVIAKPQQPFSEKDKFIIDQFIMRGGAVLWLIDPVFASMDSLQVNTESPGVRLDLNLDDLFFRYGCRLNSDLVMDLNAMMIPVKTGQMGGQPQFDFFPWYFFPILTPNADHPVVKNLNAIRTEFISSIDFVKSSPDIDKTVLLTSSKYGRVMNTPVIISLDILGRKPDERLFGKEYVPVGVLLEGKFESAFANRIPPEIAEDKNIGFTEISKQTRMIAIADGDIIKSQMQFTQGTLMPLPLGYDKYTGQQFGNKELLLNAMNYLTDNSGLITIRSRELKLRLLDQSKTDASRIVWQTINIMVPVLIVIILGIVYSIWRKRKYTR